jgi:hypothetical protein
MHDVIVTSTPTAGSGPVETPREAVAISDAMSRVTVSDVLVAIAIAAAAAWLRRRQLGPPSLWLDDAWPALVSKVGWIHVPEVGLTAPGFAAILKLWLDVTGFTATKAQSVAFTFGIAGPALIWLLCIARGLGRPAAALATVILVTAPADIVYSARVKQYTLDTVLVIGLLCLGWRLITAAQENGRWIQFTIAAIVATAISSALVPVACGGYVAGLFVARRAGRDVAVRLARYLGAYGVFGAVWWLVMLRPRLGPALHQYWRAFYFQTNNPVDFAKSVVRMPTRFDMGFADIPGGFVIVLVLAAAVVCWKWNRDAAMLLFTPLLLAVVLSLLQLAPLGTGRTDLYLYPILAVVLAVGASEVIRRAKFPGLFLVGVVVVALVASATTPSAYPQEDMKRAVQMLAGQAQPGDTVMVYYGGKYAFALYSPWPISVSPTKRETNGFDVRIHRSHTVLLPSYHDRTLYPATVKRLSANVKRLWLIGAHGHLDVVTIERALVAAGFDTHRRLIRGLPVFLSVWNRS